MTDPATGTSTTTVLGLAALMAFMPFGVSLETLMLGGACFFGGSCARTGLSLYKKLDGSTEPVNLGRNIAALLCTIPIAAVASCIVFLAAHVTGLNADAALGGLLLIMGVRGPEGFQWLVDQLSNVFTRVIPTSPKPGDKTGGTGP